MIAVDRAGWKIDRVKGVELFTAPDGTEYVRADAESAEVALPSKTFGLQPTYLRRRSAESIVKAAERKERKAERREAARRKRSR